MESNVGCGSARGVWQQWWKCTAVDDALWHVAKQQDARACKPACMHAHSDVHILLNGHQSCQFANDTVPEAHSCLTTYIEIAGVIWHIQRSHAVELVFWLVGIDHLHMQHTCNRRHVSYGISYGILPIMRTVCWVSCCIHATSAPPDLVTRSFALLTASSHSPPALGYTRALQHTS